MENSIDLFCVNYSTPKEPELVTMFNQTSNLESSHAMSGRVTPPLQRVRFSFENGDLLNQGASNTFPPSCCQEPCLKEQYYPTAILNFYRFLSGFRKCHTHMGIKAVFTNLHYALKQFIVYDYDFWLSSKPENTNAKGKIPPRPEGVRVSFYPLNPTL